MEIEIDVECNCGKVLQVEYQPMNHVIVVQPCKECVTDEVEKIKTYFKHDIIREINKLL